MATVWATLKLFGYEDVYNELKADTKETNLHRLENILTLAPSVHDAFDLMDLWLEAIPNQVNLYRVVLAPYMTHKGLGRSVL